MSFKKYNRRKHVLGDSLKHAWKDIKDILKSPKQV